LIEIKTAKDQRKLRRLALAAQGLLQARPYGQGISGARKAISHIGYVQVDTISVVERAHNHVIHSRVPGFKPEMISQMLRKRDIFEFWSHAAAFLPIEDYRFSLPYKEAIRNGQVHWYKKRDTKLMGELLARIRSDGPIRSRDLEAGSKKGGEWWDWKPSKIALEQLYMEGELMVSDREGFQKVYNLTERVLPSEINTASPTIEEFAEHLLNQQIRCHGLVSLKGLTYLRKVPELKLQVKQLVDDRLAQRDLEQIVMPDGERFLLAAGALDETAPRAKKRMQILSPFDNSVIQRQRLKTLFNFEYQLECYLPEAKRQYGYFCLPLLYGDQFVGRMDCKAHRKERHLEIRALYLETYGSDQAELMAAFVEALAVFLRFQQCDTVSLVKSEPSSLAEPLRLALSDLN